MAHSSQSAASFDTFRLTGRARFVLSRHGIKTVEALIDLGPTRVRLLHGIGPLLYQEIQQAFRTSRIDW
jgi:hypothetical protein